MKKIIMGEFRRMVNFAPFECGNLVVRLAKTEAEKDEAYRLRYEELLLHYNKNNENIEKKFKDVYDDLCDHLICCDITNQRVVGTYRLVMKKHIEDVGSFVTEDEYDISKIKSNNILELGRAVVTEDYRGGSVIKLLWRGLIKYAKLNNVRYMFGTGSFFGNDINEYKHALSYIYYNHLSPQDVRVQAREHSRSKINLISPEQIDLRKAKNEMPTLIKGYIKIGATFGEDAFIDVPFNSIDVFVLLDVDKVDPRILKRFLT